MVRSATTLATPSRIMTPKPTKDHASDERFILVLGQSGVGKSSFINAVSNSTLRIGSALSTSTEKVEISLPFFIDGQCFRLVDTPGFDEPSKSDTDVLSTIASFLASEYTNGRRASGIIYIHSIASNRMGGTGRRNFTMLQKLAGRRAIKNVAIVTTRWDQLKSSTATARETELTSKSTLFKHFLENGATMFRYDRRQGIQPAQTVIRHFISLSPIPLLIQREMVDEGKLVSETTAGIELQKDLRKQMEDHHKTMRQLKEEFHSLKTDNDISAAKDVRQEMILLKAKFDKVRDDCRKLTTMKTALPAMRILISPTPHSGHAAMGSTSGGGGGATTSTPVVAQPPRSRMNSFSSIPALPPAPPPPPPIITSTPVVSKGKSREIAPEPQPPAQVSFSRPRAPSFSNNNNNKYGNNATATTPRRRRDSSVARQRQRDATSHATPTHTHTRGGTVHHSRGRSHRTRGKELDTWDDLRMFLFVGILLLIVVPIVQRARALS